MKIFMAHAKEDEDITSKIYLKLKTEGYSPWMDIHDIPGGINWDFEIQKNFDSANIIIIILSEISTNKNGYIRKEINDALTKLNYHKPGDIFVVPLLIDSCSVPREISSKIQFIDYKREDGWKKLINSLQLAADQQQIELLKGTSHGPFNITTIEFEEKSMGIPAHELEISYPKFSSSSLPNSAVILTDFYAGLAASTILDNRTTPWSSDFIHDEEYPHTFTSTLNDTFNIFYSNKNTLSVLNSVYYYGAGAAHGNHFFLTNNFYISNNDSVHKLTLYDFFNEGTGREAINKLKQKCLDILPQLFWEKTDERASEDDINWFKSGIMDNNLETFTFDKDGFHFHFSPYQLHCYALGSWTLNVAYFEVIDYINKSGIYSFIRGEL